jgi:DNA-binding NtrC family response regulator
MTNVMLVEDDLTQAELIHRTLAPERDLKIEHAPNLGRARELLKTIPFALVLLDYKLPDGTGLDLFSEIRAQHANLPIVFLTSLDSAELCARVFKGGAVDYVVKKRNYLESLPRVVRKALKTTVSSGGPANQAMPAPKDTATPMTEQKRLVASLERNRWNRSLAAQELGISRITLWRRMWKYKLCDRGSQRTLS